jgi:hypothetical protein
VAGAGARRARGAPRVLAADLLLPSTPPPVSLDVSTCTTATDHGATLVIRRCGVGGLRGTGEKHETELFRCRRRRRDHEEEGAIGWDGQDDGSDLEVVGTGRGRRCFTASAVKRKARGRTGRAGGWLGR